MAETETLSPAEIRRRASLDAYINSNTPTPGPDIDAERVKAEQDVVTARGQIENAQAAFQATPGSAAILAQARRQMQPQTEGVSAAGGGVVHPAVSPMQAGREAFSKEMNAGWDAIIEGAKDLAHARSYEAGVQSVRKMVLGGFNIPFSILSAPTKAILATIDAAHPGILDKEVLPDGSVLRAAMGGSPPTVSDADYAAMSVEQQQAIRDAKAAHAAPMTGKELLENILPIVAMVVAGKGSAERIMRRAEESNGGMPGPGESAAETGLPVSDSVVKAAGDQAPIRFQKGAEPMEAVRQAETELGPDAHPDAVEARINQIMGVPAEEPVTAPADTSMTIRYQKAAPGEVEAVKSAQGTPMPEGPGPGVNVERLNPETPEVNRITVEINRQLQERENARLAEQGLERTSEGAGGVTQTHAQTAAQAAEKPWTIPEVFNGTVLRPGDTIADLPARLAGLKAVGDVVNKHLDSLVEFAKAGDTSAAEDLNAAVALSQLVESRIKEVTSATARAQEFQKVPRDSWLARIDPVEYEQTIGRMNAEMLPEQTAQILSGLKEKYGADTANSWASNWVTAAKNGGKIAWELFTNSLLSGPKTIAKKFLSDLATALYAIPQRAIMRANHVLFFSKDPLGTQEGEASALAYGLGKGIVNTVRLASEGKEFPGVATWTHEPALTAANVGVNPDTFLGRGIDKWVGPAIRTPGRTIEQLTNIAQTVDYQMELGAQAIRQARIELGPFEDSETYADRFADRVQYIQDHPAEFPAVDAGARDAAIRMTYTQELGSAGKAFQSWVDQVPGLRASMPFLRIPINLGKRMTHFFPPTWGVSALFGEMNRQLKMGGAAREAALADLQAGVIGSAAVAFLVTSGHITGGGPTDKALKERWLATGRREYSFYPNGMADDGSTGYSYHNLLPWGGTIGLIADLAEIHAQLPEDSPWYERSLQIGTAIALSTSKSFKDEPMMLGLSRTLNALVAPDKEANHFTEGWAQSLVPALVRQFNHVYLDNAVKEIRGPLDALRAAVYGPSVVDRRDPITGDKILFPPGLGPDMVSPISISTIKGDPVAQELLDQRVKVSRLPWVIDGSTAPHLRMEEPTIKEGIPLTPEQRDSWIDYMTQEPLFNGRTLQEALQKKIDSPSYQKLSGWPESDRREMELRQIISAYREKARVSMLREDWDLNLDLIENERQRNQARKTGMLPGETTPSPAPVDTRPPTPAPGPAPQPVTGSMVTPSSPMTTQPSPQLEVGR